MEYKILIVVLVLCNQFTFCQDKKVGKIFKDSISHVDKYPDFFKQFTKIYGVGGKEDDGLLMSTNISEKRGDFEIYLVHKNGAKKWYDLEMQKYTGKDYDRNAKVIKVINQKTIKELSKDFNLWVFYIDKKNLIPDNDGPISKIPSIVEVYYLKAGTVHWNIVDSFMIKKESDRIEEYEWRQKYLDKIVNGSNKKYYDEAVKIWEGQYYFKTYDREEILNAYEITIKSLDDIKVKWILDKDFKYYKAQGKIIDTDKIEISFDKTDTICLEKSGNNYFISGYPICMINPGNDNLQIEKIK